MLDQPRADNAADCFRARCLRKIGGCLVERIEKFGLKADAD